MTSLSDDDVKRIAAVLVSEHKQTLKGKDGINGMAGINGMTGRNGRDTVNNNVLQHIAQSLDNLNRRLTDVDTRLKGLEAINPRQPPPYEE